MIFRFAHFSDHKSSWPWLPYFTPKEMADYETGELVVVPDFMDWLVALRVVYDRKIIINDATRSCERQKRKNGKETGAHPDGVAIDTKVYGKDAYDLIKLAMDRGVLGLGIHQTGPMESRFIHLDMWTSAPEGLRPRVWSY